MGVPEQLIALIKNIYNSMANVRIENQHSSDLFQHLWRIHNEEGIG